MIPHNYTQYHTITHNNTTKYHIAILYKIADFRYLLTLHAWWNHSEKENKMQFCWHCMYTQCSTILLFIFQTETQTASLKAQIRILWIWYLMQCMEYLLCTGYKVLWTDLKVLWTKYEIMERHIVRSIMDIIWSNTDREKCNLDPVQSIMNKA